MSMSMPGAFEEIVNGLLAKIQNLEARLEKQNQELALLKHEFGAIKAAAPSIANFDTRENKIVNWEMSAGVGVVANKEEEEKEKGLAEPEIRIDIPQSVVAFDKGNEVKLNYTFEEAGAKTRRSFLKKLAVLTTATGAGVMATSGQKEAQARLIVNPTDYPIQIGAISIPQGTTISGQLQDTTVRIGHVACGDPTLVYDKLPLVDTGLYAQGAGYGLYATTSRAMGTAGYFRNVATGGVGSFYAISAISNNGTAISASGAEVGIAGSSSGSSSGVYGSSNSGPGVGGFSSSGAGLSGGSAVGVPLHLDISNSVPTGGTRSKGDFYVDTLGRVYVWARNDANSADVWRQIQFIPA